jgi:DNA polymerase III delta subunit
MTVNPLSAAVTVLHGDNRLEIAERTSAAREAIDPTGFSTSLFEQSTNHVQEVASAIGSPGFFGAERLVICHNLVTPFAGARRRKSAKSEDDSDPLALLRNIAPGVWMLIIEDSLKATDEKRVRAFCQDVAVENVQVPRGRMLIDWTCERAREYQAMIDGATATRLVEALFPGTWRQAARREDVAPDLYRLDSEIAKLAVSAGTEGEITGAVIADLVQSEDALDIWGLSNAIADRDQSKAVKQLELALDSGQAAEMILGQLSAQFETLAVINASTGRPISSIARQTGLSEGRLKQATRSARNYTRRDLRRALSEIRDADFGIKQGLHEPENALSSLVAGLAQRR